MPFYHFDLVNTKTVEDEGGAELFDDIDAMDSADMIARQILRKRPELKNQHYFVLVTMRTVRKSFAFHSRSFTERQAMAHSHQGNVRDHQGQAQPADKERAQRVHRVDPDKSVSCEATRDPRLNDAEKTPGSAVTPDEKGDPPTGCENRA